MNNKGFTADIKPDEERVRFFLWITKLTLRICEGEFPIYLIRYSLFSCPWFAVKLHKILLSDDDCYHDHPWSFISIILKGGYIEHTPNGSRYYKPGSILWRPAPSIHKLELNSSLRLDRKNGYTIKTKTTIPATTLVITFKKVRVWGFYTAHGFVKWFDFIRAGRKCD